MPRRFFCTRVSREGRLHACLLYSQPVGCDCKKAILF